MKMNKVINLILAIIFLSTFCSISTFANLSEAQDITKQNIVSISDNSNGKLLSDGSRTTKLNLKAGTTIKISNEQTFSSIYIIWDKPPGEWILTIDNTNHTYGKYDFIHEYINMPFLTNEITITVNSDSVIICDVYTFTEGKTPEWVQKWNPPYDTADMLLMPTHADDELIFFGGTIPYYAGEKGLKVQVVYMTHHWGEPYRPHEALNALWAGGLTAYPVMGKFPDIYSTSLEHAKTVFNYESVIGYNVEMIRRFKPKIIIAHDLKGEYGHGAHMINSNALTEALEISKDSDIYPESAEKYGVWDVPKTYLHLYGENKVKMNWDIPLEYFDGKTAYEMAVHAFSFHVSQQKWYSVKKDAGVYDCQAFGLYRTTVGDDTGFNDFLENIKFEEESKPDSSVIDDSSDSSEVDSAIEASTKLPKKTSYAYLVTIPFIVLLIMADVMLIVKRKKKEKNK